MSNVDLYDLVIRAKNGDKRSMKQIVDLFQPLIQKVCRRAKADERLDLEQHLTEKIIQAVYAYDLDSVPDYSTFCQQILNVSSSIDPDEKKTADPQM
ncbi:MAG: helix-turn-helix domain-containing protein [Brevibacillus sp.]|nr:helix-turn-helix domain-containing protein [Brevibacillus sp.]